MDKIVIVAAARTPQGRFLGTLAKYTAVELAATAGKKALERVGAESVDLTILGNVLIAGQGMNPARQVALRVGVPVERPAFTVNMVCASGMQAAVLGAQAIQTGQAEVVLCGGAESMSNAPHLALGLRQGAKLGNVTLVDTILSEGLSDAFSNEHMGLLTERLAEEFGVGREAQDAFAHQSQTRWAKAHEQEIFRAELAPLPELDRDEHPRPDTALEKLATLKPAFKRDGSITAGNASGINDGAAMLVLCSERTAEAHGWQPLAEVEAWATAGCEPARMALGPVCATRALCNRGHRMAEFDHIEINEAFAAQVLACLQGMELSPEQVNPHGGAIALGHPIGASGARLLVHLAHRIAQGASQRALATLCAGGGMGQAVVLRKT